MSRARSKTADSAEVKKKGLPRRLNEKIALMKEKEQAQSEAFEQAMKSILEMQQARTGGSMPSLQAIDAPHPPYQVIATEGMHTLTTPPVHTPRERPHSGGPAGGRVPGNGRVPGIERTQSFDTHTQSMLPHHQFWNTNTEWTECDLSRHKSDSDLQQTLMAESEMFYQFPSHPHLPHPPPQSSQHHPPSTLFSPTSLAPPTSPRLRISPPHDEQGGGGVKRLNLRTISSSSDYNIKNSTNGPQSPIRLGSSVSAALLSPEYGGVANIGGATNDMGGGASSLPDLTNIEFSCGLDIPLEEDEDIFSKSNPFYCPTQPPSNVTSINSSASVQAPPNVSLLNIAPGNMPFPYFTQLPISKCPTLPGGQAHQQQHSAPLVRKFKNIVPAGSAPGHYGYSSHAHNQLAYGGNNKFPPNISLSSPPINGVTTPTGLPLQSPPISNSLYPLSYVTPPPQAPPTNNVLQQHLPKLGSESLYSPPTNYLSTIPHYLDPAGMVYQKQALQQKMAGMSFTNAPPLRSHSEENLILSSSSQKDLNKGGSGHDDLHTTQNPFMGNMSNANSVPCVYVESNNTDPCVDAIDSPTTGTGSPSTSASHASSPPLSRPLWLDQHHSMSDYMFHEWPLDGSNFNTRYGGGGHGGSGSLLSHHKSLSELNKVANDYVMDLSPSSQARAHQLSLPSIVMNDLIAVDDPLMDKELVPDGFLPTDFDMEEEVMESLLRDEGFAPFTMGSLDEGQPPPVGGHNEIIMRQDLNF